ncbi:MAG: hypothetical protein GY926_00390 [bacterium]|nr:hypothetical protein [bacterium]
MNSEQVETARALVALPGFEWADGMRDHVSGDRVREVNAPMSLLMDNGSTLDPRCGARLWYDSDLSRTMHGSQPVPILDLCDDATGGILWERLRSVVPGMRFYVCRYVGGVSVRWDTGGPASDDKSDWIRGGSLGEVCALALIELSGTDAPIEGRRDKAAEALVAHPRWKGPMPDLADPVMTGVLLGMLVEELGAWTLAMEHLLEASIDRLLEGFPPDTLGEACAHALLELWGKP